MKKSRLCFNKNKRRRRRHIPIHYSSENFSFLRKSYGFTLPLQKYKPMLFKPDTAKVTNMQKSRISFLPEPDNFLLPEFNKKIHDRSLSKQRTLKWRKKKKKKIGTVFSGVFLKKENLRKKDFFQNGMKSVGFSTNKFEGRSVTSQSSKGRRSDRFSRNGKKLRFRMPVLKT